MPTFEVQRTGDDWYKAECKSLGILITASTLAAVEQTAAKAAGRYADPVLLVVKPAPKRSWTDRIKGLFFGHGRRHF